MLIKLFIEFFKIGLFSIGGGLATVPFLYQLSNTSHWFSHQDITTMIAVAESTPGAIGINMATYTGFIINGFFGALVTTIALVLPSLIIIIFISKLMERYSHSKHIKVLFTTLRPASLAMISVALIHLAIETFIQKNPTGINNILFYEGCLLAIVVSFLYRKSNCHPLALILFSALVGIIFQFG